MHALTALVTLLAAVPAPAGDASPAAWLRTHGREPAVYVLELLDRKPVVILGEAHWSAPDVALVTRLADGLRARRASLAVEWLRAADQERLDRLVGAESWDEALAISLLREAEWPYRDYLELLRAAWKANRAPGPDERLRVVALAPARDWRESLPRGVTYDEFMAERVLAEHAAKRRVLVYCGIHHAFTRYAQPETDLAGRARGFMDRMGNVLFRQLGERVVVVALHKPMWCGTSEPPSYCLPLNGSIDCAAEAAGKGPVAFDVVPSPFGEMKFPADSYYSAGHPALRLLDFADGYVWTGPVEGIGLVRLLSLDEYAPEAERLDELARRNPFTNEANVTVERLREIWRAEAARRDRPLEARGWDAVSGWRRACEETPPPRE